MMDRMAPEKKSRGRSSDVAAAMRLPFCSDSSEGMSERRDFRISVLPIAAPA